MSSGNCCVECRLFVLHAAAKLGRKPARNAAGVSHYLAPFTFEKNETKSVCHGPSTKHEAAQ